MKRLTEIEVLLTILVLDIVLTSFGIEDWLKSLPNWDPVRQLWEPGISSAGEILWSVTFVSWTLFTVVYFIVMFLYLGASTFQRLMQGIEYENSNDSV